MYRIGLLLNAKHFRSLEFHGLTKFVFLYFFFQFGQVEIVAACIIEHYPRTLSRYRELVVLVICVILFLLGLSCVTEVSYWK